MKFIKRKIAVCLLVLFACTGMAMAQNYTSSQQGAYNKGYENGTNGAPNTCTTDNWRIYDQKACNDGYTAGYQATHN